MSAPAVPVGRLRVELRFSVGGRARYLSHLECVDMLLAGLRRSGVRVALSLGMRPKPVISLALARAVGVAADDEICVVDLAEPVGVTPAELCELLNATLPRGLVIESARTVERAPRVTAARYRVAIDGDAVALARAAERYATDASAPVERRSPKGDKMIDAKRTAPRVELVPGGFEIEIALDEQGSARPDEVARALAERMDAPLVVTGMTRTALRTAVAVAAGAKENE